MIIITHPCASPALQLQWLWEQAMRKLAGCQSIQDLFLSHLRCVWNWLAGWLAGRVAQELACVLASACRSSSSSFV